MTPTEIQRALYVESRAKSNATRNRRRAESRTRQKVRARNLARIEQVHAASLQPSLPAARHIGSDKQETPDPGRSEASTDRNSGLGSNGGRCSECA
jgi:hypothetical protein